MADYMLNRLDQISFGKDPETEREQIKSNHFYQKVWSAVKDVFTILAVQIPRVYMFITIPAVVVLGPLFVASSLCAFSVYKTGKGIYHYHELKKLRKEIQNGNLPEALKNLSLEKIDMHKFDAREEIVRNAAVLGIRLAAVLIIALVIASLPLAPYSIPVITGLGLGILIGSVVVSAGISAYRRPKSAKEMYKLTNLKAIWHKFRLGQHKKQGLKLKQQLEARGSAITEQQIVKLESIQNTYNARKERVVVLKNKILQAGVQDTEKLRRKAEAKARLLPTEPPKRNLTEIVDQISLKDLSRNEQMAIIKFFKVNPLKLEKNDEDHLRKKLKVFFSKDYDGILARAHESKDLFYKMEEREMGALFTGEEILTAATA